MSVLLVEEMEPERRKRLMISLVLIGVIMMVGGVVVGMLYDVVAVGIIVAIIGAAILTYVLKIDPLIHP